MSSVAAASASRWVRTERGEGRGPHQRGVARQHDEVAFQKVRTGLEAGERDRGGVAGAQGFDLFDELDAQVGGNLGLDRLDHVGRTEADHDDDTIDRQLGEGVKHVEEHRTPADPVEGLRHGRAHPGPLARGENDRREGSTGHGPIMSRGAGPWRAAIDHDRGLPADRRGTR